LAFWSRPAAVGAELQVRPIERLFSAARRHPSTGQLAAVGRRQARGEGGRCVERVANLIGHLERLRVGPRRLVAGNEAGDGCAAEVDQRRVATVEPISDGFVEPQDGGRRVAVVRTGYDVAGEQALRIALQKASSSPQLR
jgi:hypothetical protein